MTDNTRAPDDTLENPPTVSCARCDRTWELAYELDELQVGNRSIEQFALDHRRHTGHFPDEIQPWLVDCGQCPAEETFLSETPARRWAQTHSRHTTHAVELSHHSIETEQIER